MLQQGRHSLIFILCIGVISITGARTVSQYLIKKPGEASSMYRGGQLSTQDNEYLDVVDDQVLAREEFARIKMLELEGREPYQETRKTSITRTY